MRSHPSGLLPPEFLSAGEEPQDHGQVSFTLRKVFPYLLLGVGIGALIHNWIPEGAVEAVLGSRNPLGVVITALIGVPMYADIFGTIPVAEALLSKGALPGTVVSFMMAVTTLGLPSLILLRKAVHLCAPVHAGNHRRRIRLQRDSGGAAVTKRKEEWNE